MPCTQCLGMSKCRRRVNGNRLEGGDNTYLYKSLIGSLFRYSKETQEGQLFSVGFMRDDHAAMDGVTNTGFLKRKEWTAAGAVKDFKGKLNLIILNQVRFLVPGDYCTSSLNVQKTCFRSL